MNPEHENRILEAGLEEVLGGHYPPDLSARILQAMEERAAHAASATPNFVSAAGPLPSPNVPIAEPVAPPIHREELALPNTRSRKRHSPASAWLSVGVAASLLIVLASVGIYVARNGGQLPGPDIAEVNPDAAQPTGQPETLATGRDRRDSTNNELIAGTDQRNVTPRPEGQTSTRNSDDAMIMIARVETVKNPPSTTIAQAKVKPVSDSDVIRFVNDTLSQRWQQQGITPAPPVDDPQWCQRVYQRLVGRKATESELDQFMAEPNADRRRTLVDNLLASEEYARHWADVWADALKGSDTNDLQREENLENYLFTALKEDKPYDQIATELISATGACDANAEDFNGASAFLASLTDEDYVPAADRVSRVFLGKQLVCARCHDHPANGWDQSQFWELNAFFQQMKLRRDSQTGTLRLVNQDFYGKTGVPQDAEVFYEDEDGRLRIAYPQLNGVKAPRSGLVADVDRRQELARQVVASSDFRSSVVNRIWAELLQYGFVEPVDDAGPHNPPSHPELLQHLSSQLAAHDFNLDGLVRWIVLSRAFELSDQQTPESWMDTPETGGRPMFARFYAKPRQSRDLYQNLMLAVRSRPPSIGVQAGTLARRSWSPAMATTPEIIDTQGAELLAGPRWLDLLASSSMSREQKIEHLFLSVLDRQPTRREKMAAKLVLADRMNDQVAVRELWQTLAADQAASRSATAER